MTITALERRTHRADTRPAFLPFDRPADTTAASLRLARHAVRRKPSKPAPSESELVQTHTPLVRKIAYGLCRQLPANMELDDLLQAGMIGLLEAIRGFDAERGVAFATYAGVRINGAMMDEIRRVLWAPRSVYQKARRVDQAVREIQNETGRRAADREVADRLGIDAGACQALLGEANVRTLCPVDGALEANVADGGEGPLEHLESDRFAEHLATATTHLSERERSVMQMYYIEDLKLHEIGRRLGLTESRVCQLHKQAVGRLREMLASWCVDDTVPA